MKRATALQLLAATIVLVMVVGAFPLAEIVADHVSSSSSSPSSGSLDAGTGAANAGPRALGPAGDPNAYPGAVSFPTPGGTSSRPGAGSGLGVTSTGSTLLDQVIHTARLMGYDTTLPDLPLDKLAPVNPLRPAIVEWVTVTNSKVPADQLEAQLERADALPQPLQRDLALLVLSAAQATLLQGQALARLTPAQVTWIYEHPELATQLARGVDTPETRELAQLAGLVDTGKSIEASLLLLEAVEATRGSLANATAEAQLSSLSSSTLDPQTAALVKALAGAGVTMDDQQKVLFAANVVAVAAGVPPPGPVQHTTFQGAVSALLNATGQVPDASALKSALSTASLLPGDLQDAIATPLLAEAKAVSAANPLRATPQGEASALVNVLAAVADAIPTLEKYNLYWRATPEQLRVGQWAPAARAGWEAENAAMFASTGGNLTQVAQAGGVLHGADVVDATVPDRSFVDAYAAVEAERGYRINQTERGLVEEAGATLDPTVRAAAAHMMSGVAESARLDQQAFAGLTPQEKRFLLQPRDTTALYTKANVTMADVQLLAQLTRLASKVDVDKLTQSEVVAARAITEAKDMLSPTYGAQAASTRPYTPWDWLLRLLPWGDARAQAAACAQLPAAPAIQGFGEPSQPIVTNDCRNDVLLVLNNPDPTAGCNVQFLFCTGQESEIDQEVLVITGTGSSTIEPQQGYRLKCPFFGQFGFDATQLASSLAQGANQLGGTVDSACYDRAPAVGSANVFLDLGGSDVYDRPVAVSIPGEAVPVHLHLDMGGADVYVDPTPLYDDKNPLYYSPSSNSPYAIGSSYGIPTEGSALGGGVAILLDNGGDNSFYAPSLSQGYGQWGLGLLATLGQGSDSYSGKSWVQGASGRDMNLGLGILLDSGGARNRFRADSGQGYGLGGVLLELGGQDFYTNGQSPQGQPIAHLDVLPGGDVTTVNERGNDRVWVDGPSQLDLGLGVSLNLTTDPFGFERFMTGVDPNNPTSTAPLTRVQMLAQDSDHDGYPDFIERALGTDPNDPASYPAGIPRGPTFFVPGLGEVTPGQIAGGAEQGTPTGQDKIIDLRVPLQNAGTVDFACVGPSAVNYTGPESGFFNANAAPQPDQRKNFIDPNQPITIVPGVTPVNSPTAVPNPFYNQGGFVKSPGSDAPQGPCLLFSYQPTGSGQAQGSIPTISNGAGATSSGSRFENVTLSFPAGILAVGDSVATTYDVDYFFVVDLGGDDTFLDRAGGALPVKTQPIGNTATCDNGNPGGQGQGFGCTIAVTADGLRNSTFFAPSLVLNVDVPGSDQNVSAAGYEAGVYSANQSQGNDQYLCPTFESCDFSQGAMGGVLVDTAGDNNYVAGDGSQGSMGGVLLDLGGNDSFTAGNFSQGANVVTNDPGGNAPGLPGGDAPNDYTDGPTPSSQKGNSCTGSGTTCNDQGVRRVAPGLLLHLGTGTSTYVAGMDSQGSARGYSTSQGQGNGTFGAGILLDQGGNDTFDAATKQGVDSQGVGGWGGAGILMDLQGDTTYRAWGVESQGAPISATHGTFYNDNGGAAAVTEPGAGVLVDGDGNDSYVYFDQFGMHDRSAQRQDNLTITRGDLQEQAITNGGPSEPANGGTTTPYGHLYAQPGVALDTEATDPNVLLDSLFGTGNQSATSLQSNPSSGTPYVNIPTARFAIGSGNDDFEQEYAFVVDLGSNNTFHMNAGGFVPELLGRFDGPLPKQVTDPTGSGQAMPYEPLTSLYPVSFLLDAGQEGAGSNYTAPAGFAQGAGYFSVGVLVDMAGNSTFTVLPQPVPSFASQWMPTRPTLDGNVGATEWGTAQPLDLRLTSLNDSRYQEPMTLRVTNDAKNIYVAIQGHTSSDLTGDGIGTGKDVVTLDINGGRTLTPWDASRQRTLIDESQIELANSKCGLATDWHYDQNGTIQKDLRNDTRVGCSVNAADGTFTLEITKPLRDTYPPDVGDLDMAYGPRGYTPDEIAIHVSLFEHSSADDYVWPAGTVRFDGQNGYPENEDSQNPGNDLQDEVADWAVFGLAWSGPDGVAHDGVAHPVTKEPAFAQGAGLAGVGILASLAQDEGSGSVYTASDDAQGFGAYNGIGLLLGGQGSDTYVASTHAQGAAEFNSLGALIEPAGDDTYRNAGESLGDQITSGSLALFADLGGYDTYQTRVAGAQDVNARNATVDATDNSGQDTRNAQTIATPVGDVQEWSGGGQGIGIDALSDDVRSQIGVWDTLLGSSRTLLQFQQVNATGACDAHGSPFPDQTFGQTTLPVATGTVCLVATPTLNQQPGVTFSVDAMDFLVDGRDVATLTSVNGGDGQSYVVPLDVTTMLDGVRTIFAQATIKAVVATANGQQEKAILFHDKTPDAVGTSLQRLVVNNPTHVATCTLPKLDVPSDLAADPCASDATAVYSPTAINGTNNLSVLWAVSHDAFEDQDQLAQGWALPADHRNVPCPDDNGSLCNVIPLWLRKSTDGVWNTQFPGYGGYDPEATSVQFQNDQPYTIKSDVLHENLTVTQQDGFHVKLYDHTALVLGGNFTTRVIVTLLHPDNSTVFNATNQPVVIADETFTAARSLNVEDTNSLLGVGPTLRPLFDQARGVVSPGTVDGISSLLDSRPASEVAAEYDSLFCESGSLVGGPLCVPQPTLNGTADTADNTLGGLGINDTYRSLGSTEGGVLNWTDFFVKVNGTPASPLVFGPGTVTIPAGYKFEFDMYIGSDSTLSQTVDGIQWYPIYHGNVTSTTDNVANASAPQVSNATTQGPGSTACGANSAVGAACTFVNGEAGSPNTGVWSEINSINQGDEALVPALAHPLPVATFRFGDAADPSVFEIRTPTHPHTSAQLDVEALNPDGSSAGVARTLASGIFEGDVPGSPNATFQVCDPVGTECHPDYGFADGALRATQRQIVTPLAGLGDGSYQIHLSAADDSTNVLAEDKQPFLLDSTPPSTGLASNRVYIGAALLAGGNSIPVTWSATDAGSGVKQVGVWAHIGTSRLSDPGSWTFGGDFPATTNQWNDPNRITTINDYYFIFVGEDRAGNVELQDRIREMANDPSNPALQAAIQSDVASGNFLHAGFLAKLQDGVAPDGAGGFSIDPALVNHLVVESEPPTTAGAPQLTGALTADYGGVNALFVRAGAPFDVRVCARDRQLGIAQVLIIFDHVDTATGNVTSWNATATNVGPCEGGGDWYSFSGWGAVDANKTLFPDGQWSITADVFDLAGNRDELSVANVILDSVPPTVTLVDPVYPAGQQAVKPGDRVTLRLAASDAFGVDAAGIALDARALNQTGLLAHCTVGGPTDACLRETVVNRQHYTEVSLLVDKAGVPDGTYSIPVTVPDNAGNLWQGAFNVTVDTSRFTMVPGSIAVSNATYANVTVHWSTTTNTTSMVRYGTSPLDLKSRTPVNMTLVKDHEVVVDGLDPSTHYYMTVVSETAGGYVNESDVFDAVTGTALYLQPLSPSAGDKVSGLVPVRFSGGLRTGDAPITFTLESRPSSDQPWSFVTTLTENGADHELDFNSSRYLDGPSYELRLTADSGKDNVSVVLGPFLSDNTPPELDVLAPLEATNQSMPEIAATATDNLAGFGPGSANLTIDGQAVPNLTADVGNLTLRVVYDVPTPLASGWHELSLSVTDLAGNVATQAWRVAVDDTPPVVTLAPVQYEPGPSAAKNGSTVTLNLTATDESGVASVVADLAGLADQPNVSFDRVDGTDQWLATFVVTDGEPSAVKHVAITATDIAGNPRVVGVDVPVDNTPPTLQDVRASDITMTEATLLADASKPVTLVASATARDVPPASAVTTSLDAHPVLTLTGLFPSRSYQYQVQAFDDAGNEVDYSGTFQTALDLIPPTKVESVSVVDLLNGTLRLSWAPAHDNVAVDYYRVYRMDDNGTLRPVAQVRGLTFEDVGLPLEKPFTYQIAAVDYGGNEGPRSDPLRALATAVPRLTGGVAAPSLGSIDTVFRYVVTYASPGGVPPAYVHVILDGAAHDMKSAGGGVFEFDTKLAPHTRDHPHTYSFEASDGRYTVRFPEDGSALRGPLVSADAVGSASSGVASFAQRVPWVGLAGSATAFLAAAAVVTILRRRGWK